MHMPDDNGQLEFSLSGNGLTDIARVRELFRRHRVSVVYCKTLAKKEDNDKNQIYLGRGLNSVSNVFPTEIVQRGWSESRTKRRSSQGKHIFEGRLNFHWMDRDGKIFHAPETKIIDYFQYPEIRLSGFLKGCDNAPSALRRKHQAAFGQRILIMGVTPARSVIGMVLTGREDPLVERWPELPKLPASPILQVLLVDDERPISNRDALFEELENIFDRGWVNGQRLRVGETEPVPFRGTQAGGYTLEALLGVPPNAQQAPDKYGYEIKSKSRSSRVSLMTPVADRGFEGDNSFGKFMNRYGWPCKKNPNQKCFNGTHHHGIQCASSGLILNVDGFDPKTCKYTLDTRDVQVALRKAGVQSPAAAWSLGQLLKGWNKKHAAAAYVSTEKRAESNRYRFGRRIWVGEGTNIGKLLEAICRGHVVYDPGHKIRENGVQKVRPQWRLIWTKTREGFRSLYNKAEEIEL
jgi:hypothetical protein